MSSLDWIVLLAGTAFIVIYGIWKTRKPSENIDDFLMGNRSSKWWTIGLSVMATQASAITFLSTPGQGYDDGMRFLQFYFGLPIAMIIICIVFIPRYVGMKVFTVYEFLENRFDLRTRLLAAFLFLIQRGLGAGITIFAPSIIFSAILGWNLNMMIIVMGVTVTLYTALGGTTAVSATHKLQMGVMMGGILTALVITIISLPDQIGFSEAIQIADVHGKLSALDFSFDLNNRYTFWSGITGGAFLALAYFGTDQSQAQRYITGQSIRESRMGLIFNAIFKIPMQFIILLAGVMVFVFYQFSPSPLFFNEHVEEKMMATPDAAAYAQLQETWYQEHQNRMSLYEPVKEGPDAAIDREQLQSSVALEKSLRADAKSLINKNLPEEETNDRDYVFIRFILDFLPKGIIGLLIAAILAAGMSSTAAELNALASTTTVDFYKRLFKNAGSDKHYVVASKLFTVMWGLIAIGFASVGSLFENLIQFVNIIGSLFYGTILGIFLSAFLIPRMSAVGVFIAALVAEAVVLSFYFLSDIGFLWYNVIGCSCVVVVGLIISLLGRKR